ncbi:2-amino-4-hydroxy-6-hydroxymethyldihydropteridine diphosphokinase [Actinomyces sp.]|uniref:2-amino-4-hydroxy-6- hydroxymethyldihydropteridine diphosphokinase n=1 Tax=Actinomyces sp. TaxID=29317 RepID=UPI0026DAFDDF|nr:2-amino-4-hydroxy-6-hydroxymethyldihydropteridine diphosphokinase [Actinomyces sp.]MDO4901549.1 2-amino-4-hydroxy-6-hydroxymethyldihydropteridine diphosphokinase [Actinomyces sp.]
MSTNHATPDRIALTGLSARGYHGLLPFERTEGQLFTADVTVFLGDRGTAVAAVTDSVTDAVNYVDVARAVVGVIEGEPVGLIETLAERISDTVLAFPRVSAVEVTVHKPQAPLDVAFDDVSVTISRNADAAGEASMNVAAAPAVSPSPAPAASAPLAAPLSEEAAWGEQAAFAPVAASPTPAPAAPAPVSGLEDEPAAVEAAAPVSGWEAEPSAAPAPAEDFAAPGPVAASPAASAPAEPLVGPQFGGVASEPEAVSAQPSHEPWPIDAPQAPAVAPAPIPEAVPAPVPQPPADPLTVRPQAPVELVIALGGNVGGVVPSLRTAVGTLRNTDGIDVTTVAPLARTAAVVDDGEEQPDYLNTVVLATTTLSPREVLAVCQDLEAAAGRVRTRPQGPRTLDADIITYEGVTSTEPELTLPHPRAAQRAFVLTPWAQADPFAEIGDQSVAALAETAPDRDGVRWLALDWLDSDHLPALPTGQYVAPPEVEEAPAAEAPAEPIDAGADAAQPADPWQPQPEPVAQPAAPAPPEVMAEQPWPAEPSPSGPVGPAQYGRPQPVQPWPQSAPLPSHSEQLPQQPEPGQSHARHVAEPVDAEAPAAPPQSPVAPAPADGDEAAADEHEWAAPPNWNDVIGGRNGQEL